MQQFGFRLTLAFIVAAQAALLVPGTAVAQTPPSPVPAPAPVLSPEDKVEKAAEAAEEAAKAARDAALATQRLAETLGLQLKPAVPPPPPTAPLPTPPASHWNGAVGLNLISDTGNATAFAGKLGVKINGTWHDWILTIVGSAAYGQSEAFHTYSFITTALNADLTVRVERNFTKNFGVYALGGAMTDHVASIAYTAYGEVGASVIWYELKEPDYVKARVRTDFGFRYTHELDFQFYANATTPAGDLGHPRDIWAARAAVSILYAINKTALFTEDADVLYDILVPKDVRANSLTTISAAIAKGLSLSLSFKVRYIGVPAPGALPTDTELSAGITYTF
jgi:hypothetical protein